MTDAISWDGQLRGNEWFLILALKMARLSGERIHKKVSESVGIIRKCQIVSNQGLEPRVSKDRIPTPEPLQPTSDHNAN